MSGYVDPRGVYYPPSQPYLAYGPGTSVRFFRSQRTYNGEMETEAQYMSSQQAAGWAAARVNPNRIPFVVGPHVRYNLPSGPSDPRQLLEQRALPPNFDGGYERMFPGRYLPQARDMPIGGGAPGGAGGCGVMDMASAVAMGLKKALPELATAIGVEVSRGNSEQMHSAPANIEIPIRAFEFNERPLNPVLVSDTTFVTITSHLVPVGAISVANSLLILAETPAALSDVEARVLVDNIPVPRYDSLNCPDFGEGGAPGEVNIKAIEQQRIVVQARSRTVGMNHNVVAQIRGWDSLPSRMVNLDGIAGWRGQ